MYTHVPGELESGLMTEFISKGPIKLGVSFLDSVYNKKYSLMTGNPFDLR